MKEPHDDNRLLEGLEIVELGEGLISSLCGSMLAGLGATVVKIEPPQGDWLRHYEPQVADQSLAYRQCSAGKKVVVPHTNADYQAAVRAAIGQADAVIDHPDSHCDSAALEWVHSMDDIVRCNIHDDVRGNDLRLGETGIQATTGLSGYLGSIDEAPRTVRADVGAVAAATFTAQAVLAALFARERTDACPAIAVSASRSVATIKSLTWAAQHDPDAWVGFHCNAETGPVQVPYQAADGPISFDLGAVTMSDYEGLAEELALDIDMSGLTPSDVAGFGDDAIRFRDAINRSIENRSAHSVGIAVQRARGISVPYTQLARVPDDPQVLSLQTFRTSADSVLPLVRLPIRSVSPAERPIDDPVDPGRTGKSELAQDNRGGAAGPLAGVKVLDLGIAGVGPWGATLLAYLGADVVKIESPAGDMIQQVEPDQNGRRTTYGALNLGKRVRVLDLKAEDGIEALKQEISGSDVITENFRPGVMQRLGLDPEEILRLNPRIVTFSSTGYGVDGPLVERRATDGHIQALSGFAAANGRGGTPEVLRYNGFLDLLTSTMNTLAMLAGLLHTQRTGQGSRITNTMLGTAIFAEQVALASAQFGVDDPDDLSERAEYAPAGAFQTRDGWVAIEARNDHEWNAFEAVVAPYQADSLTVDVDTNSARCTNRAALRKWIETATRQLPTRAWVLALRKAGVPAAAFVRDAENLGRAEAGDNSLITSTGNEEYGTLFVGSPPWEFSNVACPVSTPAGLSR
ncbi:hypothetical protein GS500_14745 [Rhodococcus hoagii]|nr:hypothetical protein [Prescottella equi]